MQNDLMPKQCRARDAPYGLANKVMNVTFIGVDFHLCSIMWTFQNGTGRELTGRLATSATSANRASCYGSESLAPKLAMLKGSAHPGKSDVTKCHRMTSFGTTTSCFHTQADKVSVRRRPEWQGRAAIAQKNLVWRRNACAIIRVVQVHCDDSYWGSGGTMLCYIILYYTMLCYTMLCYTVLRFMWTTIYFKSWYTLYTVGATV